MVVITRHVGAIVAASAHGLGDLERDVRTLWPYALVPFVPRAVASPAFLVASTLHFAADVSLACSVGLHVLWGTLHVARMDALAWHLFAAYYCGVHVPRRVRDSLRHRRYAMPCVVAFLVGMTAACPVATLDVGPRMQSLVTAHVMSSYASGTN